MVPSEDDFDSEDEEREDPDEYVTRPKKISGFHGFKKCYVLNVVQYNTVFILFRTEIDERKYPRK